MNGTIPILALAALRMLVNGVEPLDVNQRAFLEWLDGHGYLIRCSNGYVVTRLGLAVVEAK